jgi:hypothetical protein
MLSETKDGLWTKGGLFQPQAIEGQPMSVELIHTGIGLTYLALWALIGMTTVRRRALDPPLERYDRIP